MGENIAVIFGGTSSEYSISLQSAASVLENFPKKYNAVPIWITRKGEWNLFGGSIDNIRADKLETCEKAILSPDRVSKCLITKTENITINAAFPVMHGMGGEDGTLQGLIELTGIPLCGCGTLSSAICMDKFRAHKLVSTAGIAVPMGRVFSMHDKIDSAEIETEIGFPAYVKPLRGGSSCGISRVVNTDELIKAIKKAFEFDSEIIIEQEIKGFEVGCAVMENDELITGEIDEIKIADGFFDFTEKYTPKTSQILCPAPVAADISNQIKQTAKTIYKTLGCKGFARVDMFLDENGNIIFNEVNTIPGFTEHSRFPSMMKAVGYTFSQVVEMIIEGAINE